MCTVQFPIKVRKSFRPISILFKQKKMSIPALRQPKVFHNLLAKSKTVTMDNKYVILTLKNDVKLVVSCDAYNGILMATEMYNCVFCKEEIVLNLKCKEDHKFSAKHKKNMMAYPHMEELAENLLRKLHNQDFYCTICNVVIRNQYLTLHIRSDVHKQELDKAVMRASTYKPIK